MTFDEMFLEIEKFSKSAGVSVPNRLVNVVQEIRRPFQYKKGFDQTGKALN